MRAGMAGEQAAAATAVGGRRPAGEWTASGAPLRTLN